MRKLLCFCIVFVFVTVNLQATNYYISAAGDNSDGLTPASAWTTIDKLNASFGIIQPGDSILFNCGETFYGSLIMGSSGTSAAPIVISSYGTGAKPVISGFTFLNAWTNMGENIWQCDAPLLKNNVNILTIDDIPYAVGRTPNDSFFIYQSASTTQLTSNNITGTTSYVGGEIVIRKTSWKAEKAKITAQSGGTFTYIPTLPIDNNKAAGPISGKANYGFFLQRFPESLDRFGEWYFDTAAKKMRLYSLTDPSSYTIKASCVDTVILLLNKTNIVVSNLSIEGGGMFGVESNNGINITVKNCAFNNNTKAVYAWNTNDATVNDNTINNSFSGSILISNNQGKRININNNKITNNGLLLGMGLYWSDNDLKALVAKTDTTTISNYINITGNTLVNIGFMGIQFQGCNTTVRRNVIDSFCRVIDDGGGIYTFINNQTLNTLNYRNRTVDSNFIMNAIGAPLGANGMKDVCGFFIDDQTSNITAPHNTISNVPGNGIQMNTTHDIILRDNTVYNANPAIGANKKHVAEVYNNVIKKNILYQKDTALSFFHVNDNLSLPAPVTITKSLTDIVNMDSNWISNMRPDGYGYYYSANGISFTFPPYTTLATWRGTYLHDVNSILPPVALTETNTSIEYNPGYNKKTISFPGYSKIEPKGNIYNNAVTIPKWSSIILIDNGLSSSANLAPIANAGNSIAVTLPASTTTLTGSASDTDGVVTSYTWVKISGPASGTIVNPGAAVTAINNLVAGVYVFELTATDNNGATGTDMVQVNVNKAPVANAGADKLISLPTNSVSLTGSSTDSDGTISSETWAMISGPGPAIFVTPNAAVTTVNTLVQGIYQFELTVTDNNGAVSKDIVQVTVNQPPVAMAGADKVIIVPASSITLTGTGTDTDGTITAYAWAKLSGPVSGTIVSPTAATTVLNSLVQGVYSYQLTVTDNKAAKGRDTILVTVTLAPVANAGADKLISLPINTTTLTGSGTDGDGVISAYAWVKIAGPVLGTITMPDSATTDLSDLVQGMYQFELTVTDNNGVTAKDTLKLIVNGAPLASAGEDKALVLPENTAALSGSGTDTDGTVSSYAWIKIAGPASGIILSPNAANTNLSGLVQGIYQFQLTVTDNQGGSGRDTVMIIVYPPLNIPPSVNAGTDILITLPENNTTLSGSGTDTDGEISSYEWVKISGPGEGTIATPGLPITSVNDLVPGLYQFELTIIDDSAAVKTDTVLITVNIPPVVSAGTDILISSPENSVSLTGSATDADGSISTYAWTKISGPATGMITTPNAVTTSINNLIPGIYQYQLTVTDNNGATAKDTIEITVNQAPIADAGIDKLINPPDNSTILTGTASDVDGTVITYKWVLVSGVASVSITDPGAGITLLNNLISGTYQFELTVTDNNGASGKDTVAIIVSQAPVANAGVDQLINLPISTATLTGSGTDADGTITDYTWTKIAGPATGTITTPAVAVTGVTNLVMGVYQFELTVTDNYGAIAKDTVNITMNGAPVANAGTDKTINLPANTTSLTGTGTDADGSINTYTWVKIAGPSSGTIDSPNTATTTLNSLVQGVYQYELTVTDNNDAAGKDTVQVTVNQLPIANAGSDKLISLPTNSVTLAGSGTDTDGTISSFAWVKIAGPLAGTIASPNAGSTNITSMVQGMYQFELTVTDNNGAIAKDTVQVTVNLPPLANAGADKAISLPTNTTSLTGTGTDADGTISTYAWAKIAGPVSGTIASPNAAVTALNSLVQGVYQFELTVTDNNGETGKDTVQVTINQPPVANAGIDKIINLPTNTTSLTGTGTDADGTISTYAWVKIAGPTTGTIASPTAANTALNSLVQGIYQYELTVTDNTGSAAKDTIQVTVNQPPVANAGTDILISTPANSVTLTGSGSDADGTISTYAWVKITGPSSGTIASPGAATTALNSLVPGISQYQLTVTDNRGATGKDTVQVTVNQPPVANAGTDKIINLPTNTTSLTGTGTDTDGTISSYAWVKISGPTTGTIASPTAATSALNSLVQGVYQFQLTVTDNRGATAKDTIQVTVNQPPVANAGTDKIILLPTNTTTLAGNGTDADGSISSYAWVKISGPTTGSIASASAATTALNSLVSGVYLYQLTVTDNRGATAKDTIQVAVTQAPVANAGADKLIHLPANTTSLTGSGTDPDGSISSYAWAKTSGPTTGTIASPTAATTALTNLVQGVYQFQLTVTDNRGATAKDIVQVTVNQPPVANAGADKIINLPASTGSLSGSGTDADGTISTYAWVKIAGPSSGRISSSTSASTSLSNLVQGTYKYQLTVTDNRGATAKDTVQVTLTNAPVANAGADKLIHLPVNTSSLTGSGTDADGTISSYAWIKIAGPATGTIASPTAATTALNSLVQGVYQYQLTVTDNSGATAKDTVQVTVNQPPVANAGADKIIYLPTNTSSLTGIGTDADGTISTYAWLKISGPATGTIAAANAATTALNSLVQGVYKFQLTVTDNKGATGKDTVTVTVNSVPIVISVRGKNEYLATKSTSTKDTIRSFAWINTRKELGAR